MSGVVDIWDEVGFLNIDGEDLTNLVDHDHTIGVGISGGNKAQLVSDLGPEEERGSGALVHVEETHLGDDEHNTILGRILHKHWEVTLLLDLNISRPLEFGLARGWVTDLHNVKLLGLLSLFTLTETEEGILEGGVVSHWHVSESGGKTLEDLLLSLLSEKELHVTADLVVWPLEDTNEVAPFL